MPAGMERLTQLECLWLVTKLPLQLPASLAANLQVGESWQCGEPEHGMQAMLEFPAMNASLECC